MCVQIGQRLLSSRQAIVWVPGTSEDLRYAVRTLKNDKHQTKHFLKIIKLIVKSLVESFDSSFSVSFWMISASSNRELKRMQSVQYFYCRCLWEIYSKQRFTGSDHWSITALPPPEWPCAFISWRWCGVSYFFFLCDLCHPSNSLYLNWP